MQVLVSNQLFQILQTLKNLDVEDQIKKSSPNILGNKLKELKDQIGSAVPETSIQNDIATEKVDISEINSAIEKIVKLLPIFGSCLSIKKNEYSQILLLWVALDNIKSANLQANNSAAETEETIMDCNTHKPIFGTYGVYLVPRIMNNKVKTETRADEHEEIEFANEAENQVVAESVKDKQKSDEVTILEPSKRQKIKDSNADQKEIIPNKHSISFLIN